MNGVSGPGSTNSWKAFGPGSASNATDGNDLATLVGRGRGLAHSGSLGGLLEVEPLHFTLYMASDGTRMERASTGKFTLSS